jgi:hypothetical protein
MVANMGSHIQEKPLSPDLPDEILLHVASFILGDPAPRFQGVVKCVTPEDAEDEIDHELEQVRQEFRSVSSTLRSLALTSQRFRPIAQEILLRAPILYDQSREYKISPIVNFARTLLERPDLTKYVRNLRINVPSDYATPGIKGPPINSAVSKGSAAVVDRLKIDTQTKKYWTAELNNFYPRAYCGVILALVPKLEQLHLAPSIKHDSGRELLAMLFGLEQFVYDVDLVRIPGLSNLSHLKLVTEAPFELPRLRVLSNLKSLDLSIEPIYLDNSWVKSPGMYLPSITHLRVDCRIRKIGLAHKFFEDLRIVIRMFENLSSLQLYGEPPFYNHTMDLYNAGWQPWYETQLREKSYSALLANLASVAPQLQTLELPRGFWTLPNIIQQRVLDSGSPVDSEDIYRGEVADFRAFSTLTSLIIPKAAIAHERLGTTTLADPLITLPTCITHIKVYEVDEQLWPWLDIIVENRRSHFSALTQIELLQGEPLCPKTAPETLDELKINNEKLWNKLVASGIQLHYCHQS